MWPWIAVEGVTEVTAGMRLKMLEVGHHPVFAGLVGSNPSMADGTALNTIRIQS
jgi:hypothetical protein